MAMLKGTCTQAPVAFELGNTAVEVKLARMLPIVILSDEPVSPESHARAI